MLCADENQDLLLNTCFKRLTYSSHVVALYVQLTFIYAILLLVLLLVFSPKAGFGRNQSPVRRPVWLWHTAFQAVSQGQCAIAFPRLQMFPLSPLGASTCTRHERRLSAKDGITGEKWPVNFACDSDFHVNPGFFDMPRKSATWERALLPPPKEVMLCIFSPEKSDSFGRDRTRDLGYQRPAC